MGWIRLPRGSLQSLSSNKGKSNTFFVSFRGRTASRKQSVTIAEMKKVEHAGGGRGCAWRRQLHRASRDPDPRILPQPPRSTSSARKFSRQLLRCGGSRGGQWPRRPPEQEQPGGSGLRRPLLHSLARWGRRQDAAGTGAAGTPSSAAAPGLRAAFLPGAATSRAGPDRRGCHGSSSITDRHFLRCRRRASGRTARSSRRAGAGRGRAPTLTPAAPRRAAAVRQPREEFNHFPLEKLSLPN